MSFWLLVRDIRDSRRSHAAARKQAREAARQRRRERRWTIGATAVAVGTLAFTIFQHADDVRARPEPPTTVRVHDFFSVDTSQLQPQPGSCFDFSATTSRTDAHRCFSGNLVLDPCFSGGGMPGAVVCPAMMDGAGEDVLLHVSEFNTLEPIFPDDAAPAQIEGGLAGDLPEAHAWAVELEDGNRCVFTSGATWVVSQTRLNYICDNGFVLGVPERVDSTWTVYWSPTFPLVQRHETTKVPVRTAWL